MAKCGGQKQPAPRKSKCRLLFTQAEIAKRQLLKAVFNKGRRYYAAWIFEACWPLGPVVTSKETFWPSFKVLKPSILIAEKCANKSSPPSSGVIKPKPLASLNHLTIPVAIECYFLKDKNEKTAKVIQLLHRYPAHVYLSFADFCFTYFNKIRQVLFGWKHKISLK